MATSNARGKKTSKKAKAKRKLIFLVVEVIVIAILLIALLLWMKLGQANWDTTITEEDVETNQLSEETAQLLQGYYTIALFGVDNRSNSNYDSGNSDSVMIVAINKDTKEVKVCSVYRDTYLDVGNNTYKKCNYAYNHGGPAEAISMLNTCLDLNIEDYIAVDFYALAEVVDEMGGLTIDVSEAEAAEMNGGENYADGGTYGYIQQTSEITGIKSKWPIEAGRQKLDGVQTVAYCRIRHCGGDDFSRTERQREVVTLLVEEIKNSNAATLDKVITKVLPHVSTSYSAAEVTELALDANAYTLLGTSGFPFDLTTGKYGSKGSLVVPCSLESNVAKLHEYFYGQEAYQPTDKVISISDHIKSDTSTGESSASQHIQEDNN